MGSSAHTDGPYHVSEAGDSEDRVLQVAAPGKVLAIIYPNNGRPKEDATARANARLFAASFDMHEVTTTLQRLRETRREHQDALKTLGNYDQKDSLSREGRRLELELSRALDAALEKLGEA